MSDSPDYQDAITVKQKFVKVLRGDETNIWNDKKLTHVIKILQKGPMTLEELSTAIEEAEGKKKSDITLYRYLNKLEKLNLVVPGGKRVSMDENNQLKSQTLYVRTAKLFFNGSFPNFSEKDEGELIAKATGLILEQKLNNKKAYNECILNFLEEIENSRINIIEKLVETTGDRLLEILAAVEWSDIDDLINRVGWLALILEQGWDKKIAECFSDE
ncbi:MAG: hypothetical protein ACFFCZ_16875 [Promethearchaeota archaeon]